MSEDFKETESGLVWIPKANRHQYPEIPQAIIECADPEEWRPFSDAGRQLQKLISRETVTAFCTGYVKSIQDVEINLRNQDLDAPEPMIAAYCAETENSFCKPLTLDCFEPQEIEFDSADEAVTANLVKATIILEYENGETIEETFTP